jgi:hypothetical protein
MGSILGLGCCVWVVGLKGQIAVSEMFRGEHGLAVCREVEGVLNSGLRVPEGHVFRFDVGRQTSWFLGGPGDSVSAFVERASVEWPDPGQLYAEFRVFLDEPRAIVWVDRGSRYAGEGRDLLRQFSCDRFPRAESY